MSASLVGAIACGVTAAALVLSRTLRGRVSPGLGWPHPDALALGDASWRGGLRAWEAVRAATIALAVVAVLSVGLPLAAVVVAAAAPSIWIRLRAEAARDRARGATPRIVATTEAALRSGASLPEALRRGAEASGDALASRPVLAALRAFDLGAGLDAALVAAARGEHDDRARLALGTIALGVAERLPRDRFADLLAVVGDRLAFDEQLDGEVRARAGGARQQQRLLAVLVPAIALYLSFTMPTLAATLGAPLGRTVLVPLGAALEIAGIVLSRRVVRDALR